MTKGEILDKTHWNFVTEKGISSIHGQTFPSAYKEQAEIAMDEYYNQAIDDSISKAKIGLDHCELVDNRDGQAFMNELINQLEALKKKI